MAKEYQENTELALNRLRNASDTPGFDTAPPPVNADPDGVALDAIAAQGIYGSSGRSRMDNMIRNRMLLQEQRSQTIAPPVPQPVVAETQTLKTKAATISSLVKEDPAPKPIEGQAELPGTTPSPKKGDKWFNGEIEDKVKSEVATKFPINILEVKGLVTNDKGEDIISVRVKDPKILDQVEDITFESGEKVLPKENVVYGVEATIEDFSVIKKTYPNLDLTRVPTDEEVGEEAAKTQVQEADETWANKTIPYLEAKLNKSPKQIEKDVWTGTIKTDIQKEQTAINTKTNTLKAELLGNQRDIRILNTKKDPDPRKYNESKALAKSLAERNIEIRRELTEQENEYQEAGDSLLDLPRHSAKDWLEQVGQQAASAESPIVRDVYEDEKRFISQTPGVDRGVVQGIENAATEISQVTATKAELNKNQAEIRRLEINSKIPTTGQSTMEFAVDMSSFEKISDADRPTYKAMLDSYYWNSGNISSGLLDAMVKISDTVLAGRAGETVTTKAAIDDIADIIVSGVKPEAIQTKINDLLDRSEFRGDEFRVEEKDTAEEIKKKNDAWKKSEDKAMLTKALMALTSRQGNSVQRRWDFYKASPTDKEEYLKLAVRQGRFAEALETLYATQGMARHYKWKNADYSNYIKYVENMYRSSQQ